MTLIIDHYKIPQQHDRRRKIAQEDHPYIIQRYKDGESLRALGRAYNVDKRLIQFIIDPAKQKACYLARLKRGGSKQYYNKEAWKLSMRKFRANKKQLLHAGKLTTTTTNGDEYRTGVNLD